MPICEVCQYNWGLFSSSLQAAYSERKTKGMPQSEIIFSVQESPEGGYQARARGFSIFTEADILDELKTMIRDAVSCHFENGQKPSVIRLHMVKDEVIRAAGALPLASCTGWDSHRASAGAGVQIRGHCWRVSRQFRP